ncbi:MFS transporter [Ureibacillus terrenus]|uniref:MFS transporter n=1 Tax=Ureibacillus terrenus TaxID=118246 RepID=A0A540V589_9BACL|nr:MFS transporter [Ureibacillus terrenus]TQE91911.1 MFS transporter [Ureibacillus terrenus]
MEENLWTKDFIITSFVNFLLTIMNFLFMVTMANFSVETYGVKVSTAGLSASIFVLGCLFGRVLVGKLIGRFGIFRVLNAGLLGAVMFSLSYFFVACKPSDVVSDFHVMFSLSYFFVKGVETLLLTRIFHGFMLGLASTALSTICVQIVPSSRKGEGISYYGLSNVLGAAIGPFLGMLFIDLNNGFRWLFTTNVVTVIVCLIIIHLARIQLPPANQPDHEKEAKVFNISDYIDKQRFQSLC